MAASAGPWSDLSAALTLSIVRVQGSADESDAEQRVQSPHPSLGEAAQQDIRERRRLPLPSRCDLDAVHEVQVEAGVCAEGKQVVVMVGGRGGGDGDVSGLHPAGCEKLPRPAHGLVCLVTGHDRADA